MSMKLILINCLILIYSCQLHAANEYGFILFVPSTNKISSTRIQHSIVGQITDNDVKFIECSYPFNIKSAISVLSKEEKNDFPKEIQKMFPKDFYLSNIHLIVEKPGTKKNEVQFKYEKNDNINLKKFWESLDFRKILAYAYNDSVSQININMQGSKHIVKSVNSPEYKKKWKNVFVFKIPLYLGLNDVSLKAQKDNQKYLQETVLQFYSKPSWFIQDNDSINFLSYTFHDGIKRKECVSCHEMNFIKDSDVISCKQCHEEIYSNKYMHSPAENGACFECHIPNEKLAVSETRDDMPLCEYCHSDAVKSENDDSFIHPTTT